MTKPAAITATFSDFRIIRGRKVAQLLFELPIEQADKALVVMGGLPRSDTERWFAIARLNETKFAVIENSELTAIENHQAKERRSFSSLPLSQQIGIRCTDPEFVRFCENREDFFPGNYSSADPIIEYVRAYCGVKSRADIVHGTESAKKWRELDDAFWFYKRGELA